MLSQEMKGFGVGEWPLGREGCQPRGISAVCRPPKFQQFVLQLPQTRVVQADLVASGGGELPIRGGMQAQGIPEPTAMKHSDSWAAGCASPEQE